MFYQRLNAAHSRYKVKFADNQYGFRYSRYEKGVISGRYRDMLTLIADDDVANDGLQLDSLVHAVSLFDEKQCYLDTVAIVGAMDSEHAIGLALTGFDDLQPRQALLLENQSDGNVYDFDGLAWSVDTLVKLMNNPSQDRDYLPMLNQQILMNEKRRATTDDVMWDGVDLVSHGGDYGRLLLDLQRNDGFGELTARFDLAAALQALAVEQLAFDALMDSYHRLDLLKERLFRAMSKAKVGDLSVTDVTLTKPFKRQGVANVAMQFDLSDGQSITIWFHNPDENPSKLSASDVMVSWKWLLNKRDITAAVSPKNGDNVKLEPLAMRMMKIAAKNSKRFSQTQARKQKNLQALADAQNMVNEKKLLIEQLDKEIAKLQEQIASLGRVPSSGEPIVLTGDEFGVFEDSSDGLKQLRETAIDYLIQLMKNGESIYCKAVDSDVYFDTTGIKKIKSFSSNRIKLKSLFAIKELIKNAVLVTANKTSYDKEERKRGITYDVIKSAIVIDGIEYGVRMVLRRLPNGKYQYDLQIRDNVGAIFDGIENKNDVGDSANKSDLLHHWLYNTVLSDGLQGQNDREMFDSTNDYILNLFIFDKDGNEILDEPIESLTDNTPSNTQKQLVRDGDYILTQDGKLRLKQEKHYLSVQENDGGIWVKTKRFKTVDEMLVVYPMFQGFADVPDNRPVYDKSIFELTQYGDDDQWNLMIKGKLVAVGFGASPYLSTDYTLTFGRDDESEPYRLLSLELPETLSDELRNMLDEQVYAKHGAYLADDLQTAVDVVAKELLMLKEQVEMLENQENSENSENVSSIPSDKYSQADIDYLNSIINKTIDLETVDMDYIIEIGEKDEFDPLYEQALQVISDYEDEMSEDIDI